MNVELSINEVVKLTGLTKQIITLYCRKGLLPGAYKFRGTRWRVPKAVAKQLADGRLDVSGAYSR